MIKVGLLDKKGQYAKIKVEQKSKVAEQIKIDIIKQEKKEPSRNNAIAYSLLALLFLSFLTFDIPAISILLNRDN